MKKLILLFVSTVLLFAGCAYDYELDGANPYADCKFNFEPAQYSKVFILQSLLPPNSLSCISLLDPLLFKTYQEYKNTPSNSDRIFVIAVYNKDCEKCKQVTPSFIKLARKYKNSGLRFAVMLVESAAENAPKADISDLGYDENGKPYSYETLDNVEVYPAPVKFLRGLDLEAFPEFFFIAKEKLADDVITVSKQLLISISGSVVTENRETHAVLSLQYVDYYLNYYTRAFCQQNSQLCTQPPYDGYDNFTRSVQQQDSVYIIKAEDLFNRLKQKYEEEQKK